MKRNLSPQTRQKLAILLKSRAAANGGVLPNAATSPNLSAPPVTNLKLPQIPAVAPMPAPLPLNANQMAAPSKFMQLKKRFGR